MSKGSKPRFKRMRFRKNDPAHNLLAATQHWLQSKGGNPTIVGGIEIQDWKDGVGKYRVAVHCLGGAPPQPSKEKKE